MFIDFKNPDNLLFLAILVICIIIFFVFLFLLLLMITKALRKLFRKAPESKKLIEASSGVDLQKFKTAEFEVLNNVNLDQKKPEEKPQDIVKSQQEKDQKEIAESLGSLKSKDSKGNETLESKMPSRTEETPEDDYHQAIKIPRSRKFIPTAAAPMAAKAPEPEEKVSPSINGGATIQSSASIEKAQVQDKNIPGQIFEQDKPPVSADNPATISIRKKKSFLETSQAKELGIVQKPDFMEDTLSSHSGSKINSEKTQKDDSIFGGKEEISRIELDRKLRRDPKVWKAQKDLLLNLSPLERVKLEKETFAPVYGRNISKKDLRLNLRRMGLKMAGSQDAKEKQTLRRKIAFFKKIGGIK